MSSPDQWVNAEILSALTAVALLGLYLMCYRAYSYVEKYRSLFFLFGGLAWSVNLVYLVLENAANSLPDVFDKHELVLVLSLNTISSFLFLFAAKQRLQFKHPKLFHWRTIVLTSLSVLVIPIVVTVVDGYPSRWDWISKSCSTSFCTLAIFAIGRAYQTFFWAAQHHYPLLTKCSLVYSMYLYAVLQFAYLFAAHVDQEPFFMIGMSLKLLHVFGLIRFSEGFFADYKTKRETLSKAKICIRQTAQLAHELNTPAAEMQLKLSRLLKYYRNASVVHESGNYLRNLIEQVVSLIAGYQRLQVHQDMQTEDTTVRTHNINTICDSAIISLKSVMGKQARFEKEYCSHPLVDGREAKLLQAFQNVFKNAIEATDGCKKRNVRVTTSITRDEDNKPSHVLVKIQDSGRGIEEQIIPIIFEDGSSTKGRSVERGHGLFVARKHIEEHQGEIVAKPRGDKNLPGACFEIKLPYSRSEERITNMRRTD